MCAITLPDALAKDGEPLVEIVRWIKSNSIHNCVFGFVDGKVTVDFFDDNDCVRFAMHWLK